MPRVLPRPRTQRLPGGCVHGHAEQNKDSPLGRKLVASYPLRKNKEPLQPQAWMLTKRGREITEIHDDQEAHATAATAARGCSASAPAGHRGRTRWNSMLLTEVEETSWWHFPQSQLRAGRNPVKTVILRSKETGDRPTYESRKQPQSQGSSVGGSQVSGCRQGPRYRRCCREEHSHGGTAPHDAEPCSAGSYTIQATVPCLTVFAALALAACTLRVRKYKPM